MRTAWHRLSAAANHRLSAAANHRLSAAVPEESLKQLSRRCGGCLEVLPLERFGRKGEDPHGRGTCKACNCRASRESRLRRRSPRLSEPAGYVYVACNAHNPYYKVGQTEDPLGRRRSFRTHYPGVTSVWALPVVDRHAAERELLEALAPYRVPDSLPRQETFRREGAVLEIFLSVTQRHALAPDKQPA